MSARFLGYVFKERIVIKRRKGEVRYLMKSSNGTAKKDEMKVLDVLEQHAKESAYKIAERCGLSPQKVRRIIKRLEEKELIWGYSAITGENEKNLKHFILLVKRSNASFEATFKKEVVLKKLDDYNPGLVKIENIYLTHGGFDGVVTFYAPDLISAKKLVQAINERIGQYFNDYLLIETLFPIRKNSMKNPNIKNLIEYV